MTLHKDMALDRLAELGNVAQFVAYRPAARGLEQSTARIVGMAANAPFPDVATAVATLLERSSEQAINIRSYMPNDPRSREFVYGLKTVSEALDTIARLSADGLHLIVNETIDIHDGGVSGVAHGGLVEFAPDDTPRAVEKADIASFPRALGLSLLKTVYGFAPDLPQDEAARVEFSIHPAPRGWRRTQTLLWEIEPAEGGRAAPAPVWPNRFSRHVGDKCFGLLIAEHYGAPVPRTLAIPRRVAPFAFGEPTGSTEHWLRTCPRTPQPGLYTTVKGWIDPFLLLAAEDCGEEIASVLSQAAIRAEWSGAAIVGGDGALIIEGVAGEGDAFMLGSVSAQALPETVAADVTRLHADLAERLGPVRIEWVHDGVQPWVVQLHLGATGSTRWTLVEGEAAEWRSFALDGGLPALRAFLADLPESTGVIIEGDVGLTSHIADVLRKFGRPAVIARG